MFSTRRLVLLLAVVVAAWIGLRIAMHKTAPTPAPENFATVQRQILAVLSHGAKAWDAGNLGDFVSDYLPDSGTTFITRTRVLHGVDAIRAVYAARFAPGAQRDSLHFEDVQVDVLAPDVVNTIAWYVLTRGDSIVARGPTSLVIRRVDGRWRIIHDHSS